VSDEIDDRAGASFMEMIRRAKRQVRYGIIIPACNEEQVLGAVLDELLATLDDERFEIVVGINGTTDDSATIARNRGVLVAETSARGYGHGCLAPIDFLSQMAPPVDAYIFFAADGASDPQFLRTLISAYENGFELVLASRVRTSRSMRARLANKLLGFGCGLLTGRCFSDIAPLRLIDHDLFERMNLRERTYGWTIEAQVRAVLLGACICEVAVADRPRLAGMQKVSGVSILHSLRVGCEIFKAGLLARIRARKLRGRPVVRELEAVSSRS
jgi:glycosyltransferase involved in cell wall biosynthesis